MFRNASALAALLIVASSTAPTGLAAGGAAGHGPTFGVAVETVALNVTVTTSREQYVSNLAREDFLVYDDGVPQQVTVFGDSEIPVDLALMLDVSSSLYDRFDLVRAAAQGFLAKLRPGDRASVLGFNERARVLADWTDDRRVLEAALASARAGGSTALYDSLYIGLRGAIKARTSEDGTLRRQAIVVLSDGDDTASHVSYEHVLDACRRSGVLIYTIRFKTPSGRALKLFQRPKVENGEYVLRSLARESGARIFMVDAVTELAAVYDEIATELSHQYLLGYVPLDVESENDFHTVSVVLPGKVDMQARTRLGYLRSPLVRRPGPSD